MTTKVKICGINSPDSFDATIEAGADYVGFVFFEKSPRFVTPRKAASLSARHVGGPQRVGLFVLAENAPLAPISEALAALPLDILQIYAHTPRCTEITQKFGLPVWRSVHAASAEDLPTRTEGAAALLIEPRLHPGDTRPGGLGRTLPWDMLQNWHPDFFWLLAGGLTPHNVATAIAQSGAPAVDVSSGVETAPGVKNAALIKAFVHAAIGSR